MQQIHGVKVSVLTRGGLTDTLWIYQVETAIHAVMYV